MARVWISPIQHGLHSAAVKGISLLGLAPVLYPDFLLFVYDVNFLVLYFFVLNLLLVQVLVLIYHVSE